MKKLFTIAILCLLISETFGQYANLEFPNLGVYLRIYQTDAFSENRNDETGMSFSNLKYSEIVQLINYKNGSELSAQQLAQEELDNCQVNNKTFLSGFSGIVTNTQVEYSVMHFEGLTEDGMQKKFTVVGYVNQVNGAKWTEFISYNKDNNEYAAGVVVNNLITGVAHLQ